MHSVPSPPGQRRLGWSMPWSCLVALLIPAPAAAQQPAQLPQAAAFFEAGNLQYDSLRIEGSVFFMTGDVDLVDAEHGIRLLADELQFDLEELSFEASGRVSFEQGELLLNGSAMRGDLDDGTLEMDDVVGVAPGPFYIRARHVEQVEPGKFDVDDGIVTPCNQTVSVWEFRSGSMTFKPGSYVKMSWPHIRVKGLPVFALPWVYWPLQDSARQTGLLIPTLGVSSRRGFMLSESFFWAISRSTDLTLTYEHFAKAGSGFAGEFRHSLGEQAQGTVRGYYLPGKEADPADPESRSFARGLSVNGDHVQSLPGGFVLRAQADFVSSTDFARGFQDDVDRFLQRQSILAADFSKSWGSNTLTLVTDHRENFITSNSSTVGRRLPQVKYSLRSTQIVGPVYLAVESSAARFEKLQIRTFANKDDKVEGGSYGRFDVVPDVSVQLTQIPWLTFRPFFGWRATYWTHSEGNKDFKFREEPILRNLYETGIEMVGPSVFKIFDTPGSDYSPRLKHVIQPRLVYRRINELERSNAPGRIIQFDEVDFAVTDAEVMTFEVSTRLFSKRFPDRNSQERQIWQTLEFTVGRNWDLQPLTEALEALGVPRITVPWFTTLIVQPTNRLYFRTDVNFTPDFKLAGFSLNGTLNGRSGRIGVTWFRGARDFLNPDDPREVLVETSSNSIRGDAGVNLLGQRLTLEGGIDMDLLQGNIQNMNGSIAWNLQCCSIGVDVRRLNFLDRQEIQFAVLLDLAQVGSLGFDTQRY